MIYNVVLGSGMQQSDSAIHIHEPILFQILNPNPHKLTQNTEYGSLCYTFGPCWFSVLYIALYYVNSKLLIYFCPYLFLKERGFFFNQRYFHQKVVIIHLLEYDSLLSSARKLWKYKRNSMMSMKDVAHSWNSAVNNPHNCTWAALYHSS